MEEFRIYYKKKGKYYLIDKIYCEQIDDALNKACANLMADRKKPNGKWK